MKVELVPVAVLLWFSFAELVLYFVYVRMLLCYDGRWAGVMHFAWIFTGVYYMLGFAFVSFSSPGYVDEKWMENVNLVMHQVTTKGETPFCKKCNMPRPLRAHHCKECKRCVMMMDHHCCFLGNCIGIRTFRPFLIFLFWFPVHGLLTVTIWLIVIGAKGNETIQAIVLGPSFIYFIIVGTFVIFQLVPQVSMLLRNATAIEDKEKQEAKYFYEGMNAKSVDEFGLGSTLENMKAKLGRWMLLWVMPIPNNEIQYVFKRNPEFIPEYILIQKSESAPISVIP